ncbi:hypothetical protein [Nonomuraea ferruginea]|uniref:Major facilitator superfamily (MFS) profile domain-containing protein n=2 Tax=Streptosporangiaceae TaxID=2004 RepID=A0ABT4SUN4_9ACTN|nr:hypothetical protein [Nonomuraea ferruginea]MDA0640770.1 hypothetical protein [Nonomuraea ferruginea]
MIGILCSGRLVSRFGTRPVMGVGTVIVTSLAVIGVGLFLSSVPVVMAGLFAFGVGMGGGAASAAPWSCAPAPRQPGGHPRLHRLPGRPARPRLPRRSLGVAHRHARRARLRRLRRLPGSGGRHPRACRTSPTTTS